MAALAKPDLVFRIGFAGNRNLPDEQRRAISDALAAVYEAIGTRLKELAPGVPLEGHAAKITRFYSDLPPLLRLVTGLAEGADALAAEVLLERPHDEYLRVDTAAVLPFGRDVYRDSRDESFQPTFDKLCGRCAYVLQLDGICDKPDSDTPLSQQRRSRAYRAQSMLLLRHCDVMVVVADTAAQGKAGGSLETIARALDFEIPVLLIDSNSLRIRCLEPEDDLDEQLLSAEHYGMSDSDWVERILRWVTVLVADPDPAHMAGSAETPHQEVLRTGEDLLDELFDPKSNFPPTSASGQRRVSVREACWRWFHDRFKPAPLLSVVADTPLKPFAAVRRRASDLNSHYAGLYRGTFVLNYLFAVLAVTLATLSLLLMGKQQHTGVIHDVVGAFSASEPPEQQVADKSRGDQNNAAATLRVQEYETEANNSLSVWLLGLALIKLGLVYAIFHNTRTANHGRWNDKAIDCRYLAERLRVSDYLPLVGSFQPPAASQPQFASRVLRQSSIDWLFDAIIRSTSPAEIEELAAAPAGEGTATGLLRVAPGDALQTIRQSWLEGQIAYHSNNTRTMHRMNEVTDRIGRFLNVVVIVVVTIDVLVSACYLLGLQPSLANELQQFAPFLVFSSAVLPATVAGLSGIRFQSECRRLADRSQVMQKLLERSEQRAASLAEKIEGQTKQPETDLGSWTPDVLRLAENIARDMVEEVAEWSVVYAKELREP